MKIDLMDKVSIYIVAVINDIPDLGPATTDAPAILGFTDSMFGYRAVSTAQSAFGLTKVRRALEEHVLQTGSLSTDIDPLALWKSKPVSKFAIAGVQILGAMASSAPVERVFSQSGLFVLPKGQP